MHVESDLYAACPSPWGPPCHIAVSASAGAAEVLPSHSPDSAGRICLGNLSSREGNLTCWESGEKAAASNKRKMQVVGPQGMCPDELTSLLFYDIWLWVICFNVECSLIVMEGIFSPVIILNAKNM